MNQKNIAIVDDEPTILNLLKSLLEKGNYRVSTFDNPVAALPRLSTGEYDMILLDIQMPQMDQGKIKLFHSRIKYFYWKLELK